MRRRPWRSPSPPISCRSCHRAAYRWFPAIWQRAERPSKSSSVAAFDPRVLAPSAASVATFSIFVHGLSARALGDFLFDHQPTLNKVAGALIHRDGPAFHGLGLRGAAHRATSPQGARRMRRSRRTGRRGRRVRDRLDAHASESLGSVLGSWRPRSSGRRPVPNGGRRALAAIRSSVPVGLQQQAAPGGRAERETVRRHFQSERHEQPLHAAMRRR